MNIRSLLVLVVLCVGVHPALAQQRQQIRVQVQATIERLTADAVINWTSGYIEAKGESAYPEGVSKSQARLMARRGAIVDAQRNLLESLAGVQLTAETTMKNSILVSDVVQTRVEGFIRGAVVVREQDKGDTYEVTLRLPLGEVASLANEVQREPEKYNLRAEEVQKWSPPVMPEEKVRVPAEPPKVSPVPVVPSQPAPQKAITGVIIDCRGYGLRSCMSPKIRRPDGSEVWGTMQVNPEFVNEYGIAAYLSDRHMNLLKSPEITKRIGDNPMVIRAIGVAGSGKTDPVISEADADCLLEANRQYRFLDRFGVLLLK